MSYDGYANRIDRALNQRMFLLDAQYSIVDNWNFKVMGSVGKNYDIVLNPRKVSCTCFDFKNRRRICKHIYFIVGRIAQDRNTLYKMGNDINTNVFSLNSNLTEILISRLTKRIDHPDKKKEKKEVSIDNDCSICFEEIKNSISQCGTCKKHFHDECISMWLQRKKNCPLCRGSWSIKKVVEDTGDALEQFKNISITSLDDLYP